MATTQPLSSGCYEIRCRETNEPLGFGYVNVRDSGAVADQYFVLVRDYLEEPITVRFVRTRGPERSLRDWYEEVRASASLTPTACFVQATCRQVADFLQIPMSFLQIPQTPVSVGDSACSRTLMSADDIVGIVCVCRDELPDVSSNGFLATQASYASLPVRHSTIEYWALFDKFSQTSWEALDIAQPITQHVVDSYQGFIDLLSQMRGGRPSQFKAKCIIYDGVPDSL